MDNFKFKTTVDKSGLITNLSVGGLLVIENAQKIKDELSGIMSKLSDSLEIEISEVDHIDLSFIQLIVSFSAFLNTKNIRLKTNWNLDDEQRKLIESVGLSNELFLNE